MIEAVYRDKLTGSDHLSAEFHVQLYKNGEVRVREIATNRFFSTTA